MRMTRQLRSNWLDLTLALLVVIAEAAMVAPWLYLLAGLGGHAGADIPSPLGLAFVGLFSYWGTRYFLTGGWDLSAARAMSEPRKEPPVTMPARSITSPPTVTILCLPTPSLLASATFCVSTVSPNT